MAATITFSPKGKVDENTFTLFGTIALSGNYTQIGGGGETLNFQSDANGKADPRVGMAPPLNVIIRSEKSNLIEWVPGTDSSNQKIRVNSAINTELGAGAYAAQYTGDTIRFEAVFPKLS